MKLFSRKQTERPTRRMARDASAQQAGDRRTEATATHASSQLFRRNRTLTGSLSSHVSSASEHRADLQSPRIHAHHLARRRRSLLAIFAGVVLVCGLLLFVLFTFTARTEVSAGAVSIAGQQKRYQDAIEQYLLRHPIERVRVFLNNERLQASVVQAVPEVSSIQSAGSAGIGVGRFHIVLRTPVASWMIGSTQYFVDAAGVSFQRNYFAAPAVKIVDQSGVAQTTGTAIVSRQFLSFVGRTIAVAHSYNLTVEQVVIPSGAIRHVNVMLAGYGYPVKLSLDRPAGEQVEDMKNALGYLAGKGVKPQYVDVRIAGKAYYK